MAAPSVAAQVPVDRKDDKDVREEKPKKMCVFYGLFGLRDPSSMFLAFSRPLISFPPRPRPFLFVDSHGLPSSGGIKFGMFSGPQMMQYAQLQVTNPSLYQQQSRTPLPYGPLDTKMARYLVSLGAFNGSALLQCEMYIHIITFGSGRVLKVWRLRDLPREARELSRSLWLPRAHSSRLPYWLYEEHSGETFSNYLDTILCILILM